MIHTYTRNQANQRGAVSLFIVMFSALLLTTITISFMQLMVKDQQQASYSDLSESAYDSAVAGVEDAKRALLEQQDCLGNSSATCNTIRTAIASGECRTLQEVFSLGGDEVLIAQDAGDRRLEQAYTCVKITEDTRDYVGNIDSDASAALIPLRANGSFDQIIISWGLSKVGGAIDLPIGGTRQLPVKDTDNWPENRPALLRAQLIDGQGSFRLSDFDTTGFSNTLFMYPSDSGASTLSFSLDGRRGAFQAEPQLIDCDDTAASGAYVCRATITIDPVIVDLVAGTDESQMVFLNVAALYNATDYKIELRNSSDPDPEARVPFNGVQPEVDSTGRANDLFRRVVSRVEIGNTFNYPLAALETRKNICKNFSVTTESYYDTSGCNPLTNN